MNREAPIGIFDSGFGGLTVMRAIRSLLPHENIIYFGDTAHLPYGTKSGEAILRYSIENASFLIRQGVKVLVVACSTASCFAIPQLEKQFKIPVIGMISPAVAKLAQNSSFNKIAILGTRATISSGTYQTQLQTHIPHAEVTGIPCQLLVQLVEEGYIEHPLSEMALQEYLRPLKSKQVDAILLGCTHFPLLAEQIRKEVGAGITLVDPAIECAEALKDLLLKQNLLNLNTSHPHYRFFVSDDPEKFRLLGKNFLNYPIQHVEKKA
jgi:glutamate racemase